MKKIFCCLLLIMCLAFPAIASDSIMGYMPVEFRNDLKYKEFPPDKDGLVWRILDYGADIDYSVRNLPKIRYWFILSKHYGVDTNTAEENKIDDINELVKKAGVPFELAKELDSTIYLCEGESKHPTYYKFLQVLYTANSTAVANSGRRDNVLYNGLDKDIYGNTIGKYNAMPAAKEAYEKAIELANELRGREDSLKIPYYEGGSGGNKSRKGENKPSNLILIHEEEKPMPWRSGVKCQVIKWERTPDNQEIILTVLHKAKNKDGSVKITDIHVPFVIYKKDGDTFYKKFTNQEKQSGEYIYPSGIMMRIPDEINRVDCDRNSGNVIKILNPQDIMRSKVDSSGQKSKSFYAGDVIILKNSAMTIRANFD